MMLSVLVACEPQIATEDNLLISIIADGRERTFVLSQSMTVDEFLSQSDINITLSNTDRLSPPRFTQLTDGMKVTIVRVTETSECERVEIPFQREIVQNEGLAPEEERLIRVGQNGVQEVCYRTIYEDGVAQNRIPDSQPTVLTPPLNEVVIVGIRTQVEPLPLVGTLLYINNKNAWVIKGNTTAKRPLTTAGNLDSLVLAASSDGRYAIYTAKTSTEESFLNQLWLIETSGNNAPLELAATNVIHAEWVPQTQDTISYSTGEPQAIFPFWRALNNWWSMQIDLRTGRSLNIRNVVPESSGGLLGWWGTVFRWSPSGERLGWVRADSSGIVTPRGELQPIAQYPFFRTTQNWSWRADLSWSFDGQLLATTIHGAPVGNEPPETSPAFDTVVYDVSGTFQALVAPTAGMWSSPKFSPPVNNPNSEFAHGYLAYLKAREPYNSINGEYDLIVADRDGSNARVIFPRANQAGITTKDFGITPQDFTWSPDANYLAVIYQGNLWVIDVISGASYQMTFDGQSEHPVWAN